MSTLTDEVKATEAQVESTPETAANPVGSEQETKAVEPTDSAPETAEAASEAKPAEGVEKQDDAAKKNREGFEKRRQRQMLELKIRNEILQEQLKAQANPASRPVDPNQKPVRDQFADDEQYIEALADFKVNEKMAVRERELEERKQRDQASGAVNEAVETGRKKYADFDDAFESIAHINVPNSVITAVYRNKDIAPDLIYEIATNNPDILRLPEVEAVGEIVALRKELAARNRVATPQPNKPKTSAPAPIRPPQAAGAVPRVDLSKLSGDDYLRARGYIK
jgi:hypothetical protein